MQNEIEEEQAGLFGRTAGRPPVNRRIVAAYPEGLILCPSCEIYFAPNTKRQVYCSDICRQRVYDQKRRPPKGSPPRVVPASDLRKLRGKLKRALGSEGGQRP